MSDQAKITLTGTITDIFPAEVYGNFEKRVLWLKENTENYPQHYSIEFTQGKGNELDSYNPGDVVEIGINLRGRHYEKNGKAGVINSLQGWRIKKLSANTPAQTQSTHQSAQAAAPVSANDDLPF
ncbi:DUF3127 domain-containing protein [Chitinophaga sp. HK235]|uniref:DUF3127 domain-containing protein n=1 Tax=Chitinophaga sp. HK235 TaxID=2952571 RepID=UPI001BA7AFC6|nr:DUF3127 domain-containing protein [Chitinophaga sp. HK235]